jgi:hypothetical protein
MADESQNARQGSQLLLPVLALTAILCAGTALWSFVSVQHPSDVTAGVISAFLAVALISVYREVRLNAAQRAALAKEWAKVVEEEGVAKELAERLVGLRDDISRLRKTHLSIHHLFNDRDLLRPRGGGNVDMILDAADLPPTLSDYLKDVSSAGAKARILLLDPASTLIERHRFVQQAGGDESSAVQHFRAKINSAIAELGPLAAVRIFDAVPPGNLIIVDDQIFWGGVPSVPSDASYPIIGITADTREHVYWAFRRNFDVLWKQAKPVDTIAPRATRSIAAASL